MCVFNATVFVVDDDSAVRSAIGNLCEDVGHDVRAFSAPEAFMQETRPSTPSCLVLDVRFPGATPNGLEFRRQMLRSVDAMPTVFISGHADVRIAVEAMKTGAIDFLLKPFGEGQILDAIRKGLAQDLDRIRNLNCKKLKLDRVSSLTERERVIMLLVADGLVAKQIAGRLGISEVTAKIHRAKMFDKLKVRSAIEVARLVDGISNDIDRIAIRPSPYRQSPRGRTLNSDGPDMIRIYPALTANEVTAPREHLTGGADCANQRRELTRLLDQAQFLTKPGPKKPGQLTEHRESE